MKKFFAFDIGKKGLGYCCREGSKIHCAGSLTIEPNHSSVEDIRNNRKAIKTRLFHKAREEYFNKLWHDEAGLEILDKDDERFKIEFSKQDDERIYNSTLLRIALLQNRELEKWQIYKALHNAFQRRGYDSELPWKNSGTKADEENEKLAKNYTQKNGQKLIKKEKFQYPCYYDALALGMWKERNPYDLQRIVSKNPQKIRTGRRVAPRKLVIKELTDLWTAAQKQIPELQKISADKFLYGEYREPYASYTNPDWHKNMGKEKDWQGVLGQKIPRFNNRIISKCKLLPKRNVCSADTIENIVFTLLYQLKNFRYTNSNGEVGCRLAPTEIKEIYDNNIQNWMKNLYDNKKNNKSHTFTVSKTEIEKVIGKGQIYTTKNEKFKSFQANTSGRSSFCRRALQIMNEIILTGTDPKDVNISKFVDKSTTNNPITEDEIKEMLTKVGDRNELYISDNSIKMAEFAQNPDIQSDLIIGSITNPIIRNRLQIFKNLLNDMIKNTENLMKLFLSL